ncbi:hypothetical protein Q3304_18820 [Clostridioides sp. GD02377]
MTQVRRICYWCGKLFYIECKSKQKCCCKKCRTKYKKEKQGAERRGY